MKDSLGGVVLNELHQIHSISERKHPVDGKRPSLVRVLLEPLNRLWREVVTWLILPVVICLSQRLSHACLSINKFVL